MNSQVQTLPTTKPNLYAIQLKLDFETRYIGRLDTTAQGTLYINRKASHLYRKTNSLGINYSLLHDESIKYKHIEILYNGKKYYSTREYYLKKGAAFKFSSKGFELQLFVPLDELNINTVKRFENSYCTQQDLFNQVA